MKRGILILLLLAFTSLPGRMLAGTQPIREQLFDFNQIATLAKGLERTLAGKHALVALISRICISPKFLPPGVQFSHVGFAVYSKIKTSDDRYLPGYSVYNLYQGEQRTGKSFLKQDYPVDYLSVSQELKVGVIIPNKKLQRTLAMSIFSEKYKTLHNTNYSVLSNPFNSDFQNCTEFVLDVLFAAIYNTYDPKNIKVNIAAYFEPQPIVVDRMKLNMAAMTMPDMSIEDHDGPIATATFSSIAKFLLKYGIAEDVFVYTVDPLLLSGEIKKLEF
jgi:hypothetical protein